jgi:hypothetical protein
VSDTRREDDELVEVLTEALCRHITTTLNTVGAGLSSTATAERALLHEIRHGGPLTRPGLEVTVLQALAVLPAPPVVDEAEIAARALDEAAAEFAARLPDGTPNGRAYNSHQVAQMLHDRAARLRGATRG